MSSWTHDDAPETHPLWEQQVELERGMLRSGANAYRDRVIEHEQRGQMSKVGPIRGLLHDWLPEIAKGIRGWVSDMNKSKGGPKPIALPYITKVDPYVSALVGLRAILDGIGTERRNITGLCMEIGRTIEHEERVRYWEKAEPKLFHAVQRDHVKNKSTSVHIRRVNINRFNHLIKTKQTSMTWDAWSEEVLFRVGVAIMDIIIRTTGWFEVLPDPTYQHRHGKFKQKLILSPKEGVLKWMHEALDHAELTSPDYKPTIMPPRRWTSTRGGGYWTPYVKAPRLVRFKASQESQKAGAADEYDALDMQKEFDAIHLLQETPYIVNKRVLDIVLYAWSKDMGIAKLPEINDRSLPVRTVRMLEHAEKAKLWREAGNKEPLPMDAETEKELKRWKRNASPVYRFNAKRQANMRATTATIQIAQEYSGHDAFYFPHMLDFRGRKYPIANYLQPQGSDLARGLLLLADGMAIGGPDGAGWLAIQLASAFGVDKVNFEERIKWVEEREELWRNIEANPLSHLQWSTADKPWQALAAIFEWVGYLNEGYDFVSHLCIFSDGTCNGIQHLSALTRDKLSGSYVNLVPANEPQDIYKYVAIELQQTIERIAKAGGIEGEKASYWLNLCSFDLPRTLTKRQVMVLPYGGSKDSFFTYTRKWLDEVDPMLTDLDEEDGKIEFELRSSRIVFLVNHMWDTVNFVVSGGMKVMKWLQDCAKVAALDNQPIYWVTPSGFVVRHFYGLDRAFRCKLKLDGEEHMIVRTEKTAKLSLKEQLQGISPNFIHSLDASALTECLTLCRQEGITSVVTIHDAYGTHAANMWPLNRMLRQAFVTTHEGDVLGQFRNACASVIISSLVLKGMDPFEAAQKADDMLPRPLELGDLVLEDVLESDYFFA